VPVEKRKSVKTQRRLTLLTIRSGTTTSTYRDPTDAAQVPPSVLAQHIGAPTVEHDDDSHHRERRHSVQTHQEKFSGV
jgi:hypothetical protein